MKNLFKENRLFFVLYVLILFFSIGILLLYNKANIHLFINQVNSPFLDLSFRIVTAFGTLYLIAPIIVLMAFKSYRSALTAVASSLLASLLTQIGKHLIWPDSPRPSFFFESLQELHVVEGVHLHSAHSFPSGHTAGAFALFIVLGLYSKNSVLKISFLLAACLVGYSRMYLSQHFLVDVTVGSLIGTLSAIVCYLWFNSSSRAKVTWLDKSIRVQIEKTD